MLEHLKQWLEAILPPGRYQFSLGQWVESKGTETAFFCAIQADGGAAPDVDDRRPRYRIFLLGPRNGRQHAPSIMGDMETLMLATLGDTLPCGAASVRAVGEPAGPGYTTENRAWASLSLQITF